MRIQGDGRRAILESLLSGMFGDQAVEVELEQIMGERSTVRAESITIRARNGIYLKIEDDDAQPGALLITFGEGQL